MDDRIHKAESIKMISITKRGKIYKAYHKKYQFLIGKSCGQFVFYHFLLDESLQLQIECNIRLNPVYPYERESSAAISKLLGFLGLGVA